MAVEQVGAENEVQQANILTAIDDEFDGVIVEVNAPMDTEIFVSRLRSSVSHWRKQGKKGVWIKLPIGMVDLVPPAVKEGFWYHHAEPTYIMLVYWIPVTNNTIPANATHRVGIGAFVMNEKREVLVVQEKSGKSRGLGLWKFPTGVVEEGEDIWRTAEREVREETGIETEFVELLAFSQSHKLFFEKSDLYFLCKLRPLSFEIQKQELEIEAATWMPFEEYAAQPYVQSDEFLQLINDICRSKTDGAYTGFSPIAIPDANTYLYLNEERLERH
ncbi:hypothetical protein UlMin_017520 [Ulmus minor]